MVGSPVAGVLVGSATWKTSESPYIGRVLVVVPTALLLEGAVAATGGVGPADLCTTGPRRTLRDGAVEGLGAVVCAAGEGLLTFREISSPLVPDSSLSLTSSSQSPS